MKRSSSCSLFLALIFIILTTPPFCKLQSMLRCIIMKLNSSCVISPIWIYPLSRSVKYLYRGCRWQVFQHQHCLSHRHPRFHSNREMNVLPEYEDKRYDETSKMYLLMKKLHQTYESIMLMPTSTRDRLFDMEMEYIKKQKEDIEKNSKIN